jgi:hypothetical protein
MVGESKGVEEVPSGAVGTARGGGKQRQRGQARAKLEEGDDMWGPPVSRARRGAKAA